MHERTQRAVARLLFVFCCAVPTTLTLLIVLVTWTPWYQDRQLSKLEYELNRETGLVFDIGRLRAASPIQFDLRDVSIHHPETGRLIARIRLVEFIKSDQHIGMVLHQPVIESAEVGWAWSRLHQHLIASPVDSMLPITIAAMDCSIRGDLRSLPLPNVTTTISRDGRDTRMAIVAETSIDAGGPRIRLDLLRKRSGGTPHSEVTFSTQGTSLPCAVFAEHAPWVRQLGPAAHFSGTIACQQIDDRWSFDLGTSKLSQLDLSYLTSDLKHPIHGEGDLQLRRCLIRPNEMVQITGRLRAANARLRMPMLVELRDRLSMKIDEPFVSQFASRIDCRHIAVDFQINDESLKLTGVCTEIRPGVGHDVAIFAHGRPIAWTSGVTINSDSLTEVLGPPAHQLAAWNQWLLPSAQPITTSSAPIGEFRQVRRLQDKASIRQQ